MAFLENLISKMSKGIITGKLSTAIKLPGLFAFAAIPEIMVNTLAKLILPNSTAKK